MELTMKSFSCAIVALSLCLTCLVARGDELKGLISAAARAEDPRLERKVSLAGDQVPLGAFLESLSKQTGVATQMDERDALSGIPLVVALKDVHLADAMNALWSLLSFPTAPWRWEAKGASGHYTYTLSATFAARQLPARLRAPGDSSLSPLRDKRVHDPVGTANDGPAEQIGSLKRLLEGKSADQIHAILSRMRRSELYSTQMRRIAEGAGVDILAVLPTSPVAGSLPRRATAAGAAKGDPAPEQTVAEALAPLEQFGNKLIHKWRNGALLVSYGDWFFEDTHSLPFGLVKDFLTLGDEHISVTALARLAVKATDRQFAALAEHYAVLKASLPLRPALLMYKRLPKIVTDEGATMDPDSLQYLQTTRFGDRPGVKEGRIERVRIIQIERKVRGSAGIAIEFQAYIDGRWSVLGGFVRPLAGSNAP
ncbi:MAG TPA: hypothetical protein VKT77_02430 [Chthonomonadaceae bacterium]|nr:hypothetical protein [Chthonomonadaceae bacterium]